MSRSGIRVRRSRAEWAWRIGSTLIAAVIGYVILSGTLAYSLRARSPDQSHRLAPGDGRITALLSERLSGAEANSADRKEADRLARLALKQSPLSVAAVSTLGIDAQIRGDSAAARRLFTISQKLSRRDLRTQIWAIEDAVVREDVVGALRHYDIALRTQRAAGDVLFPVLTTAMADPVILTELVRTMAGRPAWNSAFIDYASDNSADARTTAALFTGLARAGIPVSERAGSLTVNALIAQGQAETAWRYYSSIRPDADRRGVRDPHFTTNFETPSLLDWVSVNDTGISTYLQRDGAGGAFEFSVVSSTGGPLLRQVQMLPPGNYVLDGRSRNIDQPVTTLPYWALTCSDGRELARIVVPISPDSGSDFSGQFAVPANCPIQTLSLIAQPSDAAAGVSGQISHVRLRPTRSTVTSTGGR